MTAQLEGVHGWGFLQRLGFRLVFTYFPLSYLASRFFQTDWAIWLGLNVFRLQSVPSLTNTDSGDTMVAYITFFFVLIATLLVILIWSVLDFRRPDYERLHGFLRVFVRYSLASAMFVYGMAKVFNTQFPLPGLSGLNVTYAESSPMGLLWRFMGFSLEYTMFAGALELLAGVLLLFRRTTLLGALLTSAVMTNVVMLNFCYDVPVKLGSSQLLFSSIFLLLPEIPRLWQFFVMNRAVPARLEPNLFVSCWAKYSALGAKLLVVSWMVYGAYSQFTLWRNLSSNTIYRQDIINRVKDDNNYLLLNRGFHWVNETPFYR
jgi:hypothetical protein